MGSLFGLLILLVVVVPPYWMLWKRTGHSPWLSLLMVVPVVNIISVWVLAFKRWPSADTNPNISETFK